MIESHRMMLIQTLLIAGLFFSVISMYLDYNIEGYNTMKSDQTLAILTKCLQAVDTRQANQMDLYEICLSEVKLLLDSYLEIQSKREFWIICRNISTFCAMLSNVVALILTHRKKANDGREAT
jgi:magnesium-transporting ATPase (P-type)